MIKSKISVEKAAEVALKEISSKVSADVIPMVIRDSAKVFDWGIVFCWNDERGITGKDKGKFLFGRHEVLVDRISEEVLFLKEPLLDIELERYRESRNYAHVIKFPPKEDLSTLDEINRSIVLLRTQEVYQIRQGIKLIEEKKLFDLENLIRAKTGKPAGDLVLDSMKSMFWDGIVWYESKLEIMPKEVRLLGRFMNRILIMNSKLKELPNEILELKNLEKIELEHTPISNLPKDLRNLKKLRKLQIEGTHISPDQTDEFLVPKKCKLEIK